MDHEEHLAKKYKSTQSSVEKVIMDGNQSRPLAYSTHQFFMNNDSRTVKEVQSCFPEWNYVYVWNLSDTTKKELMVK